MIKKHFWALADAFKFSRPEDHLNNNELAKLQWNMDVKSVANVCRSFNPRFDREKFLSACGGLFEV